MPTQQKTFIGGVTSDISQEYLPEGVDLYRLNVRVLSRGTGQYGIIETLDGTTLVEYDLPTGHNTCIGFKQDEVTGYCYYFIYNYATIPLVSGKNSILRYDPSNNEILPVFIDAEIYTGLPDGSVLNFQSGYLITGIVIQHVDTETTLLGWTDGYYDTSDLNVYNEPKKIDIARGMAFMTGDYTNGYKYPFDASWITLIRKPPIDATTYTWNEVNGTPLLAIDSTLTGTGGQTIAAAAPPEVFQFDDPRIENTPFDQVTFEWVVSADVLCIISATLSATSLATTDTGLIELMVNGSPIAQRVIPILANDTYTVTSPYAQSLVIGDVVNIVISGSAYDIIIYGATTAVFTVTELQSELLVNNLFHQLPQFKTRFIYKDKTKSVFSSMTDFVMPYTNTPVGSGEDFQFQSDTITIAVPTGSSEVSDIEIAVRMLGDSNFSSVVVLNKAELLISDDTSYNYTFTNNSNLTPLTVQESDSLFDRVFIHCDSMEHIQGQKWLLGSGTEGWNQVDIDIRPQIDFTTLTQNNNLFFPAESNYKSGQSYDFGIIYMDGTGKRVSTSFITKGAYDVLNTDTGKYGTTVNVPFLTQENFAPLVPDANDKIKQVPVLSFEIFHTPPSWARYFQIVRSKGQAILSWIQFAANDATFYNADYSLALSNSTGAHWLVLNIGNITGRYKTENPLSTLVYSWTKGDRLRLIANPISGDKLDDFFSYNDAEIQRFYTVGDAQFISIRVDSETPHFVRPVGCLFEIYTPAKSVVVDNELTYEICAEGTVGDGGTGHYVHRFSSPSQNIFDFTGSSNSGGSPTTVITLNAVASAAVTVGEKVKIYGDGWSAYGEVSAVIPAVSLDIDVVADDIVGTYNTNGGRVASACTVTVTGGDSFKRLTNMPINSFFGVVRLYTYTECESASNMFLSNAYNEGRPNRVNFNATQLSHPARIRYSENLIEDTQINGLSTFYDLSYQDYNPAYGRIRRMWNRVEGLTAYQQLKTLLIPIEQNVLVDTGGGNLITTNTKTLNQQTNTKYYMGEYGIGTNPESWSFYGNVGYCVDVPRSAILRLSQDGLTNIAELYGQHAFWTSVCEKIVLNGGGVNVYGAYDVKNSEYVVSVPSFNYRDRQGQLQLFEGATLAFNEKENKFSTNYGYQSTQFLGRVNNGIVGFYEGGLYTMGTNETQNFIFGDQQYSEVWCVLNTSPDNIKTFLSIIQNGLYPYKVTEISNKEGQVTHLLDSNFIKMEGKYYSEVLRDENTPNIVPSPPTLPNAIFEGDIMKSNTFLVKFRYNGTVKNKTFSFDFNFIPSNPSVKR